MVKVTCAPGRLLCTELVALVFIIIIMHVGEHPRCCRRHLHRRARTARWKHREPESRMFRELAGRLTVDYGRISIALR